MAFGSFPLLNALTTSHHLGVTIPAGDWVLAGFYLMVLTISVLFGIVAMKEYRKAAHYPTQPEAINPSPRHGHE